MSVVDRPRCARFRLVVDVYLAERDQVTAVAGVKDLVSMMGEMACIVTEHHNVSRRTIQGL